MPDVFGCDFGGGGGGVPCVNCMQVACVAVDVLIENACLRSNIFGTTLVTYCGLCFSQMTSGMMGQR